MIKTCFHCHQEKPLSEFHRHSMMADGHLNKCKTCVCAYVREREKRLLNDPEWALKERRRHREKARKQRENGKAGIGNTSRNNNYRKKYPERRKAHTIVSNAVRDGKLIQMPCEKCGDEKAEAHHEDYSKPLDIIWLCVKHHAETHVQKREAELLEKLNH